MLSVVSWTIIQNDFVMKSRQYSLLPLTEDSSAAFSAPRYDLEFVGTVADAVKPWRPPPRSSRRRKRQTPRREVAGGTIATQDELTRVLGILYFLSWTRTTLVNYSMSIQKYYEIPLTERCMRRRAIREDVIDLSTNNSRLNALDTARKLEAGTELVDADPEVVKLQNKFAEVLRPTAPLTDDYLVKDRFVTVSEAAALNRLRTLIRMGGSWLKKTTDMEIWMEKNRKVLIGKASEVSSAFEHAVCGFNAVCVLGEVYGLEAVDRQNARKEYARYLARYGRPKLETYNAVLDVPKTVKAEEYIGTLQARINYHRTIIHIIGASTISIFQILLRSVPQELMETTTKALNEVASRLPPAFRNPKEPPLSEFARVFLNDPPPDTFELPFSEVERTGYKDSSKSSARPARSKKSKVERTHSVVKSVSESRGSLKESNTQNSTMAAKSAATHTNSNVPRQSKSKKKSSVSSRMPVSTSDVLSDSRSDRDTT